MVQMIARDVFADMQGHAPVCRVNNDILWSYAIFREILRTSGQEYAAGVTADRLYPGIKSIGTFREDVPARMKRLHFKELADVAGFWSERVLLESRRRL